MTWANDLAAFEVAARNLSAVMAADVPNGKILAIDMKQGHFIALNFNQQVFAGRQTARATGIYPIRHLRMS
jgi:hypothetical protein